MNESFMKDTRKWLDNLKLRAGWGVTGVIPGYPYSSMVRYTYSGGNYFRDGQWNKGFHHHRHRTQQRTGSNQCDTWANEGHAD